MSDQFQYDVFLSHSAKDKAAVRPLAERLRQDGRHAKAEVRRQKVELALQPSAFCFQPFPGAPIKGSLAQFLYINWLPADRELKSIWDNSSIRGRHEQAWTERAEIPK